MRLLCFQELGWKVVIRNEGSVSSLGLVEDFFFFVRAEGSVIVDQDQIRVHALVFSNDYVGSVGLEDVLRLLCVVILLGEKAFVRALGRPHPWRLPKRILPAQLL